MPLREQGVFILDPETGDPVDPADFGGGGAPGGITGAVQIGVLASDDVVVPVDSLPQTMGYTGDRLDYTEVTFDGVTYRQTLTYTGANLTGVSEWVAQ